MRLKIGNESCLDNALIVSQRAFGILKKDDKKDCIGTASLHTCIGVYLLEPDGSQILMHLDSNYEELLNKGLTYLNNNGLSSGIYEKILLLKSYLSVGQYHLIPAFKKLGYSDVKVFESKMRSLNMFFNKDAQALLIKSDYIPLKVNNTEKILFENEKELI